MSTRVSLTLPFTGTLSEPLLNYINSLKELYSTKPELLKELDTILKIALAISKRGFIGIYP